jgi:hypothetical protein
VAVIGWASANFNKMERLIELTKIKDKLNQGTNLLCSDAYYLIKLIEKYEFFLGYEILEKNENDEILSVKRNSDGNIFKVGEEILFNEVHLVKIKISRISLHDGEILIHKDTTMNSNKLNEVRKVYA